MWLRYSRNAGRFRSENLPARAELLAVSFQRNGAQAGGVIALLTDNTFEMIAGALAAWKTLCGYLPLDPAAPAARVLHMLTESKAALVAASSGTLPALPAGTRKRISITAELERASDWPSHQTESRTTAPDDLAYVIYTSGSTGTPKGIAVTHANLTHLAAWYSSAFGLTPDDRATQMASLAFDASVLEIWTNLSHGVPLYVLNRLVARSPQQVRDFLVSEGISISFVATPVAEELIAMEWPGNAKLRFLLTGS